MEFVPEHINKCSQHTFSTVLVLRAVVCILNQMFEYAFKVFSGKLGNIFIVSHYFRGYVRKTLKDKSFRLMSKVNNIRSSGIYCLVSITAASRTNGRFL